MRKLVLLVLLIPAAAPALAGAGQTPRRAHHGRSGCPKTFTVAMGTRAARYIYKGTRKVTHRNLLLLGRIEMCQRNPNAQGYMRWYDRHLGKMYRHRLAVRYAIEHPTMDYATASWYDDSGATASGYHAGYGVANLSLPFGTKVTFCYHGHCLDAVVDDRGPYVSGRSWDLNQNVAAALGFSGVDTVAYHVW